MNDRRTDRLALAALGAVALAASVSCGPGGAHPAGLARAALSALPEAMAVTALRFVLALGCGLILTTLLGIACVPLRRFGLLGLAGVRVMQIAPPIGVLALLLTLVTTRTANETVLLLAAAAPAIWGAGRAIGEAIATVPADLHAASLGMGMTGWQRLWRLEVPFSIPAGMRALRVALPACWMTLLAGEMLGAGKFFAPGLGGMAIAAAQSGAVGLILLDALACAMLVAAFDRMMMAPALAWAARFDGGETAGMRLVWLLAIWRRWKILNRLSTIGHAIIIQLGTIRFGRPPRGREADSDACPTAGRDAELFWWVVLAAAVAMLAVFPPSGLRLLDLGLVIENALFTTLRVLLTCGLAGVTALFLAAHIGARSRLEGPIRLLALYPPVLLYPLMAAFVIGWGLHPGFWLTMLVFPGTFLLMLLVLMGGMRAMPPDLMRAARSLDLRGTLLWRRLLLPGLAVPLADGAFAAFMWCWNATLMADALSWKGVPVHTPGLGSLMNRALTTDDAQHAALTLVAATVVVLMLSQLVWSKLRAQLALRFTLSPRAPSGRAY